MSLRVGLLALLAARPMTGFDAMRLFDASVGYLWHAPHTQIYAELRKLESAGLIQGEEVPRGKHARKRRYSLTEAGRSQLRAWMNEVGEPRRERDTQRLKAAYFEWASPAGARAQLEAHARFYADAEALYEKQREDILARRVPLLLARLERTPPAEQHAVVEFKAFAYSGLIARARTEVEWAREGLRLLDRLHSEVSEEEALERSGA